LKDGRTLYTEQKKLDIDKTKKEERIKYRELKKQIK
jgi:hypothetical protein